MQAMERNPINDLELRVLLQGALTTEPDNRDVSSTASISLIITKAMSRNKMPLK